MQKVQHIVQKNLQAKFSGNPVETQTTTSVMTSQNNQAQVTSLSSTKPEINDKRIDTLFSRLGAIYGHIWWSNFQNERGLAGAKKEWFEALLRFDNQIIKEALLMLREQKGYSPTLPQFIESCKAIQSRRIRRPISQDSNKPSSREVAEMHLKAMLNQLNS
jgi:hypothetical protein